MKMRTVAARLRSVALICALAVSVLLAHLTLSPPPSALTQDTGITISPDAQAVEEGGSVDFVVTLNATSSQVVSLGWTVDGGVDDPAEADDFATTTGVVSFPVTSVLGATSTITVQTMEDLVVEPDESFTVMLTPVGMLPPGVTITDASADGTIANDDMAGMTIADASAEEGQHVEFTITLSAPVSQVVNLTWSTANGTAVAPGDYTAVTSGTASFATNSTTTTITVDTVGDDVVEPDEGFTVTLATTTMIASVSFGDGEATGTITNNDTATISIVDADAVDEGEDVEFTVTLTAPVSQVVDLTWTVTGGMGDSTADNDFAATAGTVSFSGYSTTTTITVQTVDDDVVEPDESFTVTLATTTMIASVSFGDGEATGTITNDDEAEISIADASSAEGDGVAFVVTLSASVSKDSSFTWSTADGTAEQPGDYTAVTSRLVTFLAGSDPGATMTITVQTEEDEVVDPVEDFTVTLSTSTLISGVSIDDGEATGTITNDDTAEITITSASAAEGEGVEFTVRLSASVSQAVSLTWSTADDTAEAPGDYTAASAGMVRFATSSDPGATTTITVQTVDDDVVEPVESFRVTIVGDNLLDGVTVDVNNDVATGSITNNDTADITIANASAAEGEGVEFTVRLSASVSQAVSLTWSTADDTAEAPGDYTAASAGMVRFATSSDPGATTTITVQTVDDDVVEPVESFRVTIVGDNLLDGVTVDVNNDVGTGSITNNDMATITIADGSAAEGDGVEFEVTLSAPVSQDVRLTWTVTGGMDDPAAANDFATTTGTVSFPALATTTTITVATDQDAVVEPNESFNVTLSGTRPANVSFDKSEASGSITNNDTADITIDDGSAAEGDGVEFEVTLSAQVSQEVRLTWTTTDGTAEAPGDYTATTSGMVSFPAESGPGATATLTVETAEGPQW